VAAARAQEGASGLTTERWRRLESLCHAALARPANERAAFLADACGDDESLRAEAESLIEEGDATASFLESPVGGVASPPSLVGRQLGAYRIDAPIGAGGMGEVYRAKDTRLGRDVALKILPLAWAEDAQRRSRFEREARAVAALHHPNICTIHDVGHDQGIAFLVMELVEGESLAARLAKGPLPLDEALARAIEVADALDGAHRQGTIHRDLKPGNVMLARTGSGTSHAEHAKLLDFGLARLVPSDVGAASPLTADTPMTEAGAVLGTLQYMAPEQIEGRPADARSDIFAFGALLYEMLTGRPAFEGTSTAALIAAIIRADVPSVLPRELGRIVCRCLEKDPIRRYQSARDLINDLEEARRSLDSGSPETVDVRAAQSGRRLSRVAAASVAAGIVVTIAIAGYFGWLRSAARPTDGVQRFQLQPPGVEILPSDAGSVLAVSPDGQWVAFRGAGGQTNEAALYLRVVRELAAKRIAPAGAVPFFSPDSRWLGFFAQNAMYKVPVGGGQPQRICQVPNILSQRGASWGDDGTIVFSSDKALWRVSAAGGEPTVLTRPASPTRHYWPQVLPGSAAAVFTMSQGNSDRSRRIAVVSLKTGEVRIFPGLSGTAPRFASSGHLVYSRFEALYAVQFDLSRLELIGEPAKVLDDINDFAASGSAAFDVSASGTLVYIPGADRIPEGELVWLDRQEPIAPAVRERKRYVGAALDPNGKRVSVTIADELGEADLWVYAIDGGSWTRLTTGMLLLTGPPWSALVWSPDGQWIFFTSFKSGDGKLFRVPSGGGSAEQLTADVDTWDFAGSVSPDGTTLLYWKSLASQSDLMTLRIDPRGAPKPLTNSPMFSELWPRVSPDGRWVAYESDETGSRQIHVRSFPHGGDRVRVSPDGGASPWWSRDGRRLFYQRGPEIWSVPVQAGDTFRHLDPRMNLKADFLPPRAVGLVGFGSGTDRLVAIRREQPKRIDRMLVYVPNWLEELKHAFRQPQ
jgi:eukaryotic-like serine/threonine-protein kinase